MRAPSVRKTASAGIISSVLNKTISPLRSEDSALLTSLPSSNTVTPKGKKEL